MTGKPQGKQKVTSTDEYYIKHGIPYPICKNLDRQKERVLKNLPSIILIDGGLGTGKTNLGITVARYVQPDFDYRTQVGKGIKQFDEAWRNTVSMKSESPIKVCIFDEAHTFNKRGTMTKINRSIQEFFMVFRAYQIMIIMITPHFNDVDSGVFRTQSVRGMYHIIEKHTNMADCRSYDFDEINAMRDHFNNNRKTRYRDEYKIYYWYGMPFSFRKLVDSEEIAKSDLRQKEILMFDGHAERQSMWEKLS